MFCFFWEKNRAIHHMLQTPDGMHLCNKMKTQEFYPKKNILIGSLVNTTIFHSKTLKTDITSNQYLYTQMYKTVNCTLVNGASVSMMLLNNMHCD